MKTDAQSRMYRHRPFTSRDTVVSSRNIAALTDQQKEILYRAQQKIASVTSQQRQKEVLELAGQQAA